MSHTHTTMRLRDAACMYYHITVDVELLDSWTCSKCKGDVPLCVAHCNLTSLVLTVATMRSPAAPAKAPAPSFVARHYSAFSNQPVVSDVATL